MHTSTLNVNPIETGSFLALVLMQVARNGCQYGTHEYKILDNAISHHIRMDRYFESSIEEYAGPVCGRCGYDMEGGCKCEDPLDAEEAMSEGPTGAYDSDADAEERAALAAEREDW